MSNDKLKGLHLDPPGPELRVALDTMRENAALLKEFEVVQAEITWAKYKALTAQGFSEAAAIELCKK